METTDARLVHVGSRPFAIFPREAATVTEGPNSYIEEIVTQETNGRYGVVEVNARGILSPQQTRVLVYRAIGLSEIETGSEMGSATETVKAHTDRLLGKLGANDFAGGVSESFERKILCGVAGLKIPEPLSEKQGQTLQLGARGLTMYQIGRRMYIGENTVRTHIRRIYEKLGVYNMAGAVVMGRLYGILPGKSAQKDAAA